MSTGDDRSAKSIWLGDSESRHEFLTVAVHDLREPLRTIRSSSQMIAEMRGDSPSEDEVRYLRYISEGVDRMEGLIRDIGEYCYSELREIELTEVDLQRTLHEVQRQLAEELKKTGVVLTHDPLPAVMGDASRLATVLRCLIENACKFRRPVEPRVHIGANPADEGWVLSVRDNGLGFNPVYADRVFNPFERLNGKQYPGSGLGLTFARRIVEQHGGRIWAESQPGQGSTFWFTLPAPA